MYTNDGSPCAQVSWPNLPVVHIGAAIEIDALADTKVATAIVSRISETMIEAPMRHPRCVLIQPASTQLL